jgi:hypothetical protein
MRIFYKIIISIIYKILGISLYFVGAYVCTIGVFLTLDSLIPKEKKISTGSIMTELLIGIFMFLIGYIIFRFGRKIFQKNWRLVAIKKENI